MAWPLYNDSLCITLFLEQCSSARMDESLSRLNQDQFLLKQGKGSNPFARSFLFIVLVFFSKASANDSLLACRRKRDGY